MTMKFVSGTHASNFGTFETFIIFPGEIRHSDAACLFSKVTSAGFVNITEEFDEEGIPRPAVKCFGKSDSLEIGCSEEDSRKISEKLLMEAKQIYSMNIQPYEMTEQHSRY